MIVGPCQDGEGQVEVEREVEELRENDTCATWREDDRHVNDLSQCGVTHYRQDKKDDDRRAAVPTCADRRVVIVRVIVDGVLSVTVVLIDHDVVLVIYVAIFVVIFCN